VFLVSLEQPFVGVFAVIPNDVALAVFHAVFEGTRLLCSVFLNHFAESILLAIEPVADLDVAGLVGEDSVAVILAVLDFALLFRLVVLDYFALSGDFLFWLVVPVKGLDTD